VPRGGPVFRWTLELRHGTRAGPVLSARCYPPVIGDGPGEPRCARRPRSPGFLFPGSAICRQGPLWGRLASGRLSCPRGPRSASVTSGIPGGGVTPDPVPRPREFPERLSWPAAHLPPLWPRERSRRVPGCGPRERTHRMAGRPPQAPRSRRPAGYGPVQGPGRLWPAGAAIPLRRASRMPRGGCPARPGAAGRAVNFRRTRLVGTE
jgi:hypothetical protein